MLCRSEIFFGVAAGLAAGRARPKMLQFMHPCGVRRRLPETRPGIHGCNSRTPTECDCAGFLHPSVGYVAIHAPLRSATERGVHILAPGKVAIHALLAECDSPVGPAARLSPRVAIHAPPVECDAPDTVPARFPSVAIHAPLRSATGIGSASRGSSMLQFTHPCGVRPTRESCCTGHISLQFTHPCGVRPAPHDARNYYLLVAIHAPLRSATKHTGRGNSSFNSRTPAECDVALFDQQTDYMLQFTHPLRSATSRPSNPGASSPRCNSRTPYGVRPLKHAGDMGLPVLQFTHPLRSATGRVRCGTQTA